MCHIKVLRYRRIYSRHRCALSILIVLAAVALGDGRFVLGQQPAADGSDRVAKMAKAELLNGSGMVLYNLGNYAEAEALFKQALELRKETVGEEHTLYALTTTNLAMVYSDMGDLLRAKALYKESFEVFRKTLKQSDPQYWASLRSLIRIYMKLGDYEGALPISREAVQTSGRVFGEEHVRFAETLTGLASLNFLAGEYSRAEPLHRRALEIYRRAGAATPAYAESLIDLGQFYFTTGDWAQAERLLKQALEITTDHQDTWRSTHTAGLLRLGSLYREMREFPIAEALLRQAVELSRSIAPHYNAVCLDHLAQVYDLMRDYARAEEYHQQALQIILRSRGEEHFEYALALNNLAQTYRSLQDYERAEAYYMEALKIIKKVLGESHPEYATILNNVAVLHYRKGNYAQAEQLARQSIQIVRRRWESTSAVQSERQQLAMSELSRASLDDYLTITAAATFPPERVFGEVLSWKGAVSVRQHLVGQLLRAAGARSPEIGRLYGALQEASRELATVSRMAPPPPQQAAHTTRLSELSEKIEQLERQLANESAEFRAVLTQRERSGADIASALPEDVALVDILEYRDFSLPRIGTSSQRRCVAFIIRRGGPIVRVELGMAEPIRLAVIAWRKQFTPDGEEETELGSGAGLPTDPVEALQRLIWEKLAPHLQMANTILISPDGALARFPWSALPIGSGKYLIEEKAVAVIPIPATLPELAAGGAAVAESTASLLLIGDVDYGADTGEPTALAQARSAPRGREGDLLGDWPELKNTRQEVLAVRDSFERRFPKGALTFLRGPEPTEQRVREAACSNRYLHLATHGYFAPPQLRAALGSTQLVASSAAGQLLTRQDVAGFHPSLLSGVVLAGANREIDPDHDDGILTALEVAKLDLRNVELVTLSACQTGLGEAAGGEGLLGLQRAFQLAGARSVVASLWKVSDEAARQLMIDFYENLWTKKMPRTEALRQAQLDLMRQGIKRGLTLRDDQPPDKQRRLPPYYWATFVLSGRWR